MALLAIDHAVRARPALGAGQPPAATEPPFPAPPAHAPRAQDDGEEIVVTATKRAENLQDVPIAITAITTKTLDDLQVDDFEDYARLVPSLSSKSGGGGGSADGPGTNNVYFRGVASGENANHSASLPSVGTYLDEQPITTIGGALDIHVFDIARIEALAGPQGTLYGASSQAGTIRIITNKPDLSGTYGAGEPRGEQGRARRLGLYRAKASSTCRSAATSPPASSAGTAATAATSTISAASWR